MLFKLPWLGLETCSCKTVLTSVHARLAPLLTAGISLPTSPTHPVNQNFQGYREDGQLVLESDADEQLIIHINYNTAVKLQTIVIEGPSDGHGPKHVKLFCNRPTIGFSEAEDEAAQQEIMLTEAQLSGEVVPLRYDLSTRCRIACNLCSAVQVSVFSGAQIYPQATCPFVYQH